MTVSIRSSSRWGWGLALGAVLIAGATAPAARSQEPMADAVMTAASEEQAKLEAGWEPGVDRGRLARLVLRHPDPATRAMAVEQIPEALFEAQLGESAAEQSRQDRWRDRAVNLLLRALRDPEPGVRFAALEALQVLDLSEAQRRVGTRRVLRSLAWLLVFEQEPSLRGAGLELAGELAAEPAEQQMLFRMIRSAMRDADPEIREMAREMIRALR